MEWLKNKPGIILILNGMIVLIGLLIMYYIARGDGKEDMVLRDIEILKIEKAPYPYVDSEIAKHAEIDKRQDERIETMRKEWRVDQKEILTLIRNLSIEQ